MKSFSERDRLLPAWASGTSRASLVAAPLIAYPLMDPVIFRAGPLEVRWYGMMYLLGFAIAYFIIRSELKRRYGESEGDQAEDLLFYCVAGLLIGARIGYALFYNFIAYASQPWLIFAVWQGGMSFHGGLVGLLVAGAVFSRKTGYAYLGLADICALAAPPGLMLGRFGNFINGELFGRITDAPWGVIFPLGGPEPRHPSQLYEAILEGPVLFGCLWALRKRFKADGYILACLLCLYGVFRFSAEFLREPDPQLGFLLFGLTMGQILCALMVIAGGALFISLHLRETP